MVPDPAPLTNKWSGFINAATTGDWYFTNSDILATATGCDQTLTCSLAQAKQALVTQNDGSGAATIDTVAVSKGRDDSWAGAVDTLRINDKVYNFGPYGVLVSAQVGPSSANGAPARRADRSPQSGRSAPSRRR